MKIITEKAVTAFLNHKSIKLNNTEVKVIGDNTAGNPLKTELYLYDNLIAYSYKQEEGGINLYISSADWATSTTRERLNGLLKLTDSGKTNISGGQMYYTDSMKRKTALDKYFTQAL